MKQFAVLGLGIFGACVARRLKKRGAEVTVIDSDEKKIQDISPDVTQAVTGDARDKATLVKLGIPDMDTVIVSMGEQLESNVLVTQMLKELDVKKVIVKASSRIHKDVLIKVGADKVIIPEEAEALHLADAIMSGALDVLELTKDYNMVKVKVPQKLVGETLASQDVRQRYGITVLAIERQHAEVPNGKDIHLKQEFIQNPAPDMEFEEGDTLFVMGNEIDIVKFTGK
jgi:trk system potassium uptake protein TrkA